MSDYILAIDQGTTSSRAALFDQAGQIRSLSQHGFRQEFPRPGFVEHDPEELWDSVRHSISKALADVQAKPRDIVGIGVANQRETTVAWDRRDGRPLCNAIVWQDRRTSEYIDELRQAGAGAMIRERTGLVLDAYFSASKLRWILDNVDGARLLASEGNLRVGTVDTWVLWKLTAGRCFATDATNANGTPGL